MSFFKRSADVVQQGSAGGTTAVEDRQPGSPVIPVPPLASAAGVVPPAAAPIYSTRPPESGTAESESESVVAAKVRIAKEAQRTARDRVRRAVQRPRASAAPAPGARMPSPSHQACIGPRPEPYYPADPVACAQAGLLGLAWRWQEAGAPIRAINAYVELLERYPDTPAAAAAVADLVRLAERLADEGQFHIAFGIFDHLEYLA